MVISLDLSVKIKDAIKEKLVQLDSYVDNELPEYIMIMVANKKTQSQMTEDLSLFLNDKTRSFTKWLDLIVKRLDTLDAETFNEVVTSIESDPCKEAVVKKNVTIEEVKITNTIPEPIVKEAVVEVQPPVVQPPVVQPLVVQRPVVQPLVVRPPVVQRPEVQPPVVQRPVVQPPVVQPPVVRSRVVEPQVPASPERPESLESMFTTPDRRSVSVIKLIEPVNETIIIDDVDEDGDSMMESIVQSLVEVKSKPFSRRVASVVEIPAQRKRSPERRKQQHSLIQMAINDATKGNERFQRTRNHKHERVSIKSRVQTKRSVKDRIGYFTEDNRRSPEVEIVCNQFEDHDLNSPRKRSVQSKPTKQQQLIVNINDDSDDETEIHLRNNEYTAKNIELSGLRAKVMDDITTKNDRAYMSSLEASSEEISVMKEQELQNRGDNSSIIEKQPKPEYPSNMTAQRCFFFPNCRQLAVNCPFFHPTVACRNMSECRFGASKCRYIHQKCRFDVDCNNGMCFFMHSLNKQREIDLMLKNESKGDLNPESFPTVNAMQCKNGDSCNDMDCLLIHPKICRYGIACREKTTCSFLHPDLPLKNDLKWSKTEQV